MRQVGFAYVSPYGDGWWRADILISIGTPCRVDRYRIAELHAIQAVKEVAAQCGCIAVENPTLKTLGIGFLIMRPNWWDKLRHQAILKIDGLFLHTVDAISWLDRHNLPPDEFYNPAEEPQTVLPTLGEAAKPPEKDKL